MLIWYIVALIILTFLHLLYRERAFHYTIRFKWVEQARNMRLLTENLTKYIDERLERVRKVEKDR